MEGDPEKSPIVRIVIDGDWYGNGDRLLELTARQTDRNVPPE